MMTLDQRIEAAAKALERHFDGVSDVDLNMRTEAEDMLRAAFPELFAGPPSHWLAPMEATEEMQNAGLWGSGNRGMDGNYVAMRDAYLAETKAT